MSLSTLKSSIRRNLSNVPGWRTGKKILVIESDDWGSIRMPSTSALSALEKQGVDLLSVDSKRYNCHDTLGSDSDLADLFETLVKFKDKNGESAAFTAVSVVANPDFERIIANDFKNYYYEPFTKTLERYY